MSFEISDRLASCLSLAAEGTAPSRRLVLENDVPELRNNISIYILGITQLRRLAAWTGWQYVQSVDDAGQVTKNGEQDVDKQVGTAASLEEDAERRQHDGKDDLADIAVSLRVRHCLHCVAGSAVEKVVCVLPGGERHGGRCVVQIVVCVIALRRRRVGRCDG